MRPDWLKQVRKCAAVPCSAKIQIGHYRWYRGKYNGPLFERLPALMVGKHNPMPKLLCSTWGGSKGVVDSGVAYTNSRFGRKAYQLERGRYWVRNRTELEDN